MLLRLQKYDLDICFKPGRHMYLADTLSRAYLKNASNSSEPAAEVLVIEKELEQIYMADFLPISQPRIEEIQRETESDRAMQILKSTILQGWPSYGKPIVAIFNSTSCSAFSSFIQCSTPQHSALHSTFNPPFNVQPPIQRSTPHSTFNPSFNPPFNIPPPIQPPFNVQPPIQRIIQQYLSHSAV